MANVRRRSKEGGTLQELLEDTGGITVSGGEPCFRQIFSRSCLRKLARQGRQELQYIALWIRREPFYPEDKDFAAFDALMDSTDLVILDIKHIDEGKHSMLTGHTNANILDCGGYLSRSREAGLDPSCPGARDQ